MKTLIILGVQYGQGYYIQKPNEVISEINQKLVDNVIKFNDNIEQIKVEMLLTN